MTPSRDTYGRIRLAFLFHDADAETESTVMSAWGATARNSTVTMDDLTPQARGIVEDLETRPAVLTPQAQLHYRLSDALGAHDPDPDLAEQIRAAYTAVGGDHATWDDLPADTRAKIESVEALQRQSWDDPADAPDDIDDDLD